MTSPTESTLCAWRQVDEVRRWAPEVIEDRALFVRSLFQIGDGVGAARFARHYALLELVWAFGPDILADLRAGECVGLPLRTRGGRTRHEILEARRIELGLSVAAVASLASLTEADVAVALAPPPAVRTYQPPERDTRQPHTLRKAVPPLAMRKIEVLCHVLGIDEATIDAYADPLPLQTSPRTPLTGKPVTAGLAAWWAAAGARLDAMCHALVVCGQPAVALANPIERALAMRAISADSAAMLHAGEARLRGQSTLSIPGIPAAGYGRPALETGAKP